MKYHPWVVQVDLNEIPNSGITNDSVAFQKAAKLAMKLLPTKGGLMLKVHPEGSDEGIKRTLENFPKAVSAMRAAYDAMHVHYEEKNLLDIP